MDPNAPVPPAPTQDGGDDGTQNPTPAMPPAEPTVPTEPTVPSEPPAPAPSSDPLPGDGDATGGAPSGDSSTPPPSAAL